MPGFALSASFTLRPAASTTSPPGDWMRPLFWTSGAIRITWPPSGVEIRPWLPTRPATAPALKFILPARKSLSEIARLEATSPFTSTREPAPNSMPLGLTRNTRPFDCSAPRISEGCWPVMRLSTVLVGLCWMKRVTSPAAIENPGHWMMVPGVLVIVRTLPSCWKLAWPWTTVWAKAPPAPASMSAAADQASCDACVGCSHCCHPSGHVSRSEHPVLSPGASRP